MEPYSWDSFVDSRGRWQRVWDPSILEISQDSFAAQQISISTNPTKGTLRGLHYLEERAGEWKAVVCVQGLVQDVVVDMREESPTFKSHQSFYLDGSSNDGLLIPPGCAHGFLSLTSNTILLYIMTAPFDPDMERSLRWDDPVLNISWDLPPHVISDKDKSHGLL